LVLISHWVGIKWTRLIIKKIEFIILMDGRKGGVRPSIAVMRRDGADKEIRGKRGGNNPANLQRICVK
jgi:hypothetical protein